jgi:ribose transport system permease protein
MKKRLTWDFLMSRYPAFFPLILLVVVVAINWFLQPNMFALGTLNSNMRVFLPLVLLAVGQAIVLLGGGIDISVGGVVSIVNAILATQVGLEGSPEQMVQFGLIALLVGALAGAINGFFIAYMRLQPIITTYATSFLYVGFALFILPNPGGGIPGSIASLYRTTTPLKLPLGFYVIGVILLIWYFVSSTRYGKYLFAVGGKAEAAYETAVPVTLVKVQHLCHFRINGRDGGHSYHDVKRCW